MCGSSCYDRALGGLRPEVWETQQFERVGVPLGEQVVHFGVAWLSLATRLSVMRFAGSPHGVAEITGVGFHCA